MKRGMSIIISILGTVCYLSAQNISDTVSLDRKQALNLYIECPDCNLSYFKDNFVIVNYVEDRKVADVHLLVNGIATGSGGKEYSMKFIGRNKYEKMQDTLVFSIPGDMTLDYERSVMLDKIQLGLVPYLLKTQFGNSLTLLIDQEIPNIGTIKADPWKNWMFEIFASGAALGQQSYKGYNLSTRLNISKVTPEIKIESYNKIEFDESEMVLYYKDLDSTEINRESYQSIFSRNILVKSLGNHAGIGGVAYFRRNTFYNLDFQMGVGPAFEYNLYSYKDATEKQLRFIYGLYYEHSNYTDSTIFNRINDHLFKQELNVRFMFIKPWGFVQANFDASAYVPDLSKYHVGASAITDIKIAKGLSFNMSFALNMIRNQIGLSKYGVTPEEAIGQQREMQTSYSYSIGIGISFRFGSIFNNTVNPRFDF